MKLMVPFLAVILALSAVPSRSLAQADEKELVKILSTKRYVLHFKVDRSLVGGTVSIIDNNYSVIKTEPIKERTNIIDFFELAAGYYTVKIVKDDKQVVFQYVNFE